METTHPAAETPALKSAPAAGQGPVHPPPWQAASAAVGGAETLTVPLRSLEGSLEDAGDGTQIASGGDVTVCVPGQSGDVRQVHLPLVDGRGAEDVTERVPRPLTVPVLITPGRLAHRRVDDADPEAART